MSDWFEKISLGDTLDRCAARFGSREAFSFAGEHGSFHDLQGDVNRAARALLHSGVQAGDKVALWLANGPTRRGAALDRTKARLQTRPRAKEFLQYAIRHLDSSPGSGTSVCTSPPC